MAEEWRNDNSGALSRNDHKQEGTKQPDYRGQCRVAGRPYEIAGWVSTSQDGAKYLSLKFQPPRDVQQAAPQQETPDVDPNEIPF